MSTTATVSTEQSRATPVALSTVLIGVFVALHLPLAVAMKANPSLATAHALITLVTGLVLAIAHPRLELGVYAAGYVVGCEVLWRMSKANVFWESGKYATVVFLLIIAARLPRARGSKLPLVYLGALLPSLILLVGLETAELRDALSFNMSGPLSLAVAAWMFSKVSLSRTDLYTILWFVIAPVAGIAMLTVMATSGVDIRFSDASNMAASAGYGPNQVASMLGVGALFAFFMLVDPRVSRLQRVACGLVILVFSYQSAMTFSRGGIYGMVISLGVAAMVMVGNPRQAVRIFAGLVAVALLAEFVIVPRLEEQTEGAIFTRFSDTKVSGRDEIAEGELNTFLANPLLGVGPGGAAMFRKEGRHVAAHTEYSRMLAEHGMGGIIAFLAMVGMAFTAFSAAPRGVPKALTAALIVWALSYMTHACMRIAAPSFLFGLAMAGFRIERQPVADRNRPTVS
jgi:hypothetical protein